MSDDKQYIEEMTHDRETIIVRTSFVGIITNVLLAGFKAAIGFISHSIAVTLDAVNNLSDALSSVITVLGAKLGAKAPDKKHPLGYGRIEYLSSMLVAALVLYAGITSLIESVKKIITPEEADYSTVSLIIIAVAIVVKLLLGSYFKKQGERVNSGALVASGSDASFDAILSASVLASAVIYLMFHLSLEAYVGVVIAFFIIRAGLEMMTDTLDDILGKRNDPELASRIRHILNEQPEIRGAYDLFLYNYGPDRNYGSVHIELPDTLTVDQVDVLTRKAQMAVYEQTGVVLTGIGVYSYNTTDKTAIKIRTAVQKIVLAHEWALQMHGFYINRKDKEMRFDVVLSFDIKPHEAIAILEGELQASYPDYHIAIAADVDVSD